MSDNKERSLGDISAIDVDAKNEVVEQQKSEVLAEKSTEQTVKKEKPSQPAKQLTKFSFFTFLLFLAVLALGVLGYVLYTQLEGVKQQLDERLSESHEQLGFLQSELVDKDQTTEEALAALQGAVQKVVDIQQQQAKELVGVKTLAGTTQANKLVALEKDNKQLVEQLKKAQANFTTLQKELEQQKAAITTVQENADKALENAKNEVAALNKNVTQQSKKHDELQTQVDVLNETQGELREKLSQSFDGRAENIEKRLWQIEEAIDAFDQYRKEVNQRLDYFD